MLVSAKEMLEKAKAGHYAVGQFNINNLEWTKSILLTAQELKSPVILGVSEGAGKYMTCGEQCHYDDADAVVNGKCHGEQTGKTVVKRCGVGNHENKDNNSGDDLEIL